MSAFPSYGPKDIAARNALADALLGVFAVRGYVRHEPSILQPAQIFVDRSGEEIRRRTFEFADPSGREVCLRPDLTIPTCRWQIESGNAYPARLCYYGPAFRHQPDARPAQFYQAGAELLGLEDREAGDAEMLTLGIDALRAAGLSEFDMKIGDLALFATLIDALDVPAQWRGRLKRHFWRSGYFEVLLSRMVSGAANEAELAIEALHGLAPAEMRNAVDTLIDLQGDAPLAGRTREEILERLKLQVGDGHAPRLDAKTAETIMAVLDVSGPAPEALDKIRSLTKKVEAGMAAPLAAMEKRLAVLSAQGVDPARVAFVAHFGRNLEYYTGFVFEFWSRQGIELAGGGRYDTLIEQLGGPRSTSAIGIAIRSERLIDAMAAP